MLKASVERQDRTDRHYGLDKKIKERSGEVRRSDGNVR